MLNEFFIFLFAGMVWGFVGFSLGRVFESNKVVNTIYPASNKLHESPRILKARGVKNKSKPKINDDVEAWNLEKGEYRGNKEEN